MLTTTVPKKTHRPLWRRLFPATATKRVALLGVGFASAIAIAVTWSSFGSSPPPTVAAPIPDRFQQTKVGQVVFWSQFGTECRRAAFDNRNGAMAATTVVPCEEAVTDREALVATDRLTAVRKSFNK